MLKQYKGLYNIDYKIQVIQCNECHLERCLRGKCSSSVHMTVFEIVVYRNDDNWIQLLT